MLSMQLLNIYPSLIFLLILLTQTKCVEFEENDNVTNAATAKRRVEPERTGATADRPKEFFFEVRRQMDFQSKAHLIPIPRRDEVRVATMHLGHLLPLSSNSQQSYTWVDEGEEKSVGSAATIPLDDIIAVIGELNADILHLDGFNAMHAGRSTCFLAALRRLGYKHHLTYFPDKQERGMILATKYDIQFYKVRSTDLEVNLLQVKIKVRKSSVTLLMPNIDATSPATRMVAKVVANHFDRLMLADPAANIIILGQFYHPLEHQAMIPLRYHSGIIAARPIIPISLEIPKEETKKEVSFSSILTAFDGQVNSYIFISETMMREFKGNPVLYIYNTDLFGHLPIVINAVIGRRERQPKASLRTLEGNFKPPSPIKLNKE